MRRFLITFIATAVFSLQIIPIASSNDSDYQKTIDSHKLIGLPDAQALGYDGAGQTIVIIDDGNQINHPYLKEVIIDGNCTSRAVCGSDYLKPGVNSGGAHRGNGFHGSMVTGIIAGQANSDAPGGIAPKTKVISIDNTDGNTEGLLSAMDWILEIRKKHNVVALSASIATHNSSGTRGGQGDCSPGSDLEKKIKELIAAGITVVFAAGNGGSFTKLDFPACLSDLISVGALTHKGEIAEYSNVSQGITVMAPADIKSSNGSGSYLMGAGTSSAAPVVAGAVALLKQAKPDATPAEIKKALQTSRKFVDDLFWGNLPVLDIPKAIEVIKSGRFEPRVVSTVNAGNLSPQYQSLEKQYKELLTQVETLKQESEKSKENLALIKSLGSATGTLLEHKAGCHGLPSKTGEQAEVQAKQQDGTWKKVSSVVHWDIVSNCPPSDPIRWWAIIDTPNNSIVRWKFWIGKAPAFYPAEFTFTNEKILAQAKAEADAQSAKVAQAKAEADTRMAEEARKSMESELFNIKDQLTSAKAQLEKLTNKTITCVKGKSTKKVTAVNPRCPSGYTRK
jgi:hypothetical protein